MNSTLEAIGVDVGTKRIGIARINSVAKIAQPITTVSMDDESVSAIAKVANENNADVVVVGLPKPESGNDSEQTLFSREFAGKLEDAGLNVTLYDETLSSKEADARMDRYSKNAFGEAPSRDEVAACVFLEDYINHEQGQEI